MATRHTMACRHSLIVGLAMVCKCKLLTRGATLWTTPLRTSLPPYSLRVAPRAFSASGVTGQPQHWIAGIALRWLLCTTSNSRAPITSRGTYLGTGNLHQRTHMSRPSGRRYRTLGIPISISTAGQTVPSSTPPADPEQALARPHYSTAPGTRLPILRTTRRHNTFAVKWDRYLPCAVTRCRPV